MEMSWGCDSTAILVRLGSASEAELLSTLSTTTTTQVCISSTWFTTECAQLPQFDEQLYKVGIYKFGAQLTSPEASLSSPLILDMQEMRSCYDNLLFAATATANSAYVFDMMVKPSMHLLEDYTSWRRVQVKKYGALSGCQDGSLRRRLKNVEIPKEDLKNLEVGDFDCCC
ncbi:hypothetical protein OROHE_016708 [Orobanche hederae]